MALKLKTKESYNSIDWRFLQFVFMRRVDILGVRAISCPLITPITLDKKRADESRKTFYELLLLFDSFNGSTFRKHSLCICDWKNNSGKNSNRAQRMASICFYLIDFQLLPLFHSWFIYLKMDRKMSKYIECLLNAGWLLPKNHNNPLKYLQNTFKNLFALRKPAGVGTPWEAILMRIMEKYLNSNE